MANDERKRERRAKRELANRGESEMRNERERRARDRRIVFGNVLSIDVRYREQRKGKNRAASTLLTCLHGNVVPIEHLGGF